MDAFYKNLKMKWHLCGMPDGIGRQAGLSRFSAADRLQNLFSLHFRRRA
ncbi:MAG: hypothetical protein KA279_02900 [Neisseria sp.]|nr:hypothetical protein [Uruburuella suis]MBP6393310.1 hypothetical protein [Neisseria sp.]